MLRCCWWTKLLHNWNLVDIPLMDFWTSKRIVFFLLGWNLVIWSKHFFWRGGEVFILDFGLLRVLTDSDIYRTSQAYGLTHVDKPYANCQMCCFNVYICLHINIGNIRLKTSKSHSTKTTLPRHPHTPWEGIWTLKTYPKPLTSGGIWMPRFCKFSLLRKFRTLGKTHSEIFHPQRFSHLRNLRSNRFSAVTASCRHVGLFHFAGRMRGLCRAFLWLAGIRWKKKKHHLQNKLNWEPEKIIMTKLMRTNFKLEILKTITMVRFPNFFKSLKIVIA